ncbi:MAG: SDR family NAD(P)-dependent oxidoreductase [Rhodobacteraceae bacterium]|nr:SDR family NAD(P)-dependent oxidoreductase [Paracoccaceae bacterium]
MQGKVVVITGASAGIGAAAARAFAAEGARVALLARRGAAVAALAAEIGDAALGLGCDVSDWSAVEGAVAEVRARFGRIDVLVNNAGVVEPIARLAEADPAAWGRTQDINLKGVFHGMKAVIPVMRAQGGGTIITVSSGAAVRALEGWSAYCASKAGALMLTQAAHLEEGPQGIRVLGLSPGTVATEMQVKIKASGINPVSQLAWEDHIPPEWPARALVWMCGAAADDWLGRDVSLREEGVRRAVGLIP